MHCIHLACSGKRPPQIGLHVTHELGVEPTGTAALVNQSRRAGLVRLAFFGSTTEEHISGPTVNRRRQYPCQHFGAISFS